MDRKITLALDVATVLLAAWWLWTWATWADPEHRARDLGRAWWQLSRACFALAATAGRWGLHAELRYRKELPA